MSRSVLATFVALLLVLTSGLGSAARACGMEAASAPVASHCAEMASHAEAPAPEPDHGDRDAACKAACALASVTAVEIAPLLAVAPVEWTAVTLSALPAAPSVSADLSAEDPPPRSLA